MWENEAKSTDSPGFFSQLLTDLASFEALKSNGLASLQNFGAAKILESC